MCDEKSSDTNDRRAHVTIFVDGVKDTIIFFSIPCTKEKELMNLSP